MCVAEKYQVKASDAGRTLASLLRAQQPGLSWSQARRLVRGRRVHVNGNLCLDEARRLAEGDVVHLLAEAAPVPPSAEEITIVHADSELLVVEKPPGVTSVRHASERDWPIRRKQFQPTLEELLAVRLGKERKPRSTPSIRPVHRLDRGTSGLMLFARTAGAETSLLRQFRFHSIERSYLAVVLGRPADERIETQLVRDRGDGRRGSATGPVKGKRAVTHVRTLQRLGDYSLVECRLETGRTHQIRIHLSEKGHPVCGDRTYRKPLAGPPIADKSAAPRLALHAAVLAFDHPRTGERMRFTSALPRDLAHLTERLKHGAER